MIYLSTGGFSNETCLEVSEKLNHNIVRGLELSSGKYTDTLVDDLYLISKSYNISLHNYFPVPKNPFVFNLASNDPSILKLSLEHAKKAIDISSNFGCKYYSFHAGFLLDPLPNELGSIVKSRKLNNREKSIDIFAENSNYLADYAEKRNVKIFIENNVVSKSNFVSFGRNPSLLADPEETSHIFSRLDDNIKLLVDVAHLKVSANTLGFDPVDYLKDFEEITAAYHISDNDGLEDSNQPFKEDSWFIEHIRKDLYYYSLEIYTSDVEVLESQYLLMSEVLR